MLSVQEALLLRAAQEEVEQQKAQEAAGILGLTGGAVIGTAGGMVPHGIGNLVNRGRDALAARQGLTPKKSIGRTLRPGFRLAGGLTGAILGGALGAGTAALMKQDNEAARLLGRIQAKGTLSATDEAQLANLLGDIYSNQSALR